MRLERDLLESGGTALSSAASSGFEWLVLWALEIRIA